MQRLPHHLRHLEEGFGQSPRALLVGQQAEILDQHPQLAGEQPQQMDVFRGEYRAVGLVRQPQFADHLVLRAHHAEQNVMFIQLVNQIGGCQVAMLRRQQT